MRTEARGESSRSGRGMTAGTARGKVILLGEHAVVHGIPAIAVGIDRGAKATSLALGSASAPSTLSVHAWGVRVDSNGDDTSLGRAFRDLVAETRPKLPLAIDAEADLPPGGGLGCSAALGVAIARALDPAADDATIIGRANIWEKVFHGNPSGVDVACAALGGCVRFERTADAALIERVRVPSVFHLCVGHSGQASSTKSMVDAVARQLERRPETTKRTFDGIGTLVANARLAIEAGDRRAVGQLLDLNQMLLAGLFVSTPEIEQMCAAARGAGAFGAKLTGAGGGGCVVALVDSPEIGGAVIEAWKAKGFDGFLTTFGAPDLARDATAAAVQGAP